MMRKATPTKIMTAQITSTATRSVRRPLASFGLTRSTALENRRVVLRLRRASAMKRTPKSALASHGIDPLSGLADDCLRPRVG